MASRYLLCPTCADELHLHPEDVGMGFHERRISLTATKPPGLAVVVNGVPHPVRQMKCDACGLPIPNGTKLCVAVTHWRGEEPDRWEEPYEQA